MSKFDRVETVVRIVGTALVIVVAVPAAIAIGIYGLAKMAAVVTLDALNGPAIKD